MAALRHGQQAPSSSTVPGGRRTGDVVDTNHDSRGTLDEFTVPDPIAKLEVEDQAMFRRVFAGLFMPTGSQERVGRYELRKMIAAGGMGVVYRGFDPELKREIAIKLVSPRPGREAEPLRERLLLEAQALARLDHPNVVTVHDVGVDSGRVFLAMDLIEGPTLRERQLRGASLRDRLRLYLAAGRGLQAAHEAGIVHRDFKPDNVFIDERDAVYVGDFGLAQMLDDDQAERPSPPKPAEFVAARLTRSGDIQGTLGYMAPEQLDGRESGPAADQFAFCVALWESLCGQLPFAGVTASACLDAMEAPPRGGELIPGRLRRIVLVGLARDPSARHPSMAALLAALTREYERPRRLRQGAALTVLAGVLISSLVYARVQDQRAEGLEDDKLSALQRLEDDKLSAQIARCADLDALPDPREHANWATLEDIASPALGKRVGRLLGTAKDACMSDTDLAGLQHGLQLSKYLNHELDDLPTLPHDVRTTLVLEFNEAFETQPRQPLSPELSHWLSSKPILDRAWEHEERQTLLDCELTGCKTKSTTPSSPVDRAELRLRRGRVKALRGYDESALADYREAYKLAREGQDEERELQALIGLAKTSIMRAERFEAGEELLALAFALPTIEALEDAAPRKLALRELRAVLARQRGELEEALALQLAVVNDRDPKLHPKLDPKEARNERVAALVNLANIHTYMDDAEQAEARHREALGIDSEDPEALLNLGVLLTDSQAPERTAEARRMLAKIAKLSGHELQRSGLLVLLLLDIQTEHAETGAHRRELERLLLAPEPPPSLKQRFDGWLLVALAYASSGELGPRFDAALARVPKSDTPTRDYKRAVRMLEITEEALNHDSARAPELLSRAQAELDALDIELSEPILDFRRELEDAI